MRSFLDKCKTEYGWGGDPFAREVLLSRGRIKDLADVLVQCLLAMLFGGGLYLSEAHW